MKKNLKLVSAKKVEYITCENVSSKEIEEIINIYKPQMEGILESEKGWGLAAPQVGIKKKFFIVRNFKTLKYDIYFNAFYTKEGSTFKLREKCLTYGDRWAETKRAKSVTMINEVYNADKKEFSKKRLKVRDKDLSVAIQHEIDHLSGITIFTD